MSTAVEHYDEWHDARDVASGGEAEAAAPWHLLTIAHLPDLTGRRVLEIGCGRGAFSRYLAEHGADLVAADFSSTAVAHARTRLEPLGVEPIVADIMEIPFPDESFDLVVSQETLEHVPDPARGLAELVRVTKRGGTLIVTTPNYLSLVGLYRGLSRLVGKRYTEMGQPINQPLMLARQVRALRRLGCTIEAVDASHQLLPVPGLRTVRLRFLERPHRLMKWVEFNSLVRARRD